MRRILPTKRVLSIAAGAGTTAFTPADVGGLVTWFDASDAGSITITSGKVETWNDKSGSGNHVTQGTADARPVLSSAKINGLNAITFDGTDDTLAKTSPTAMVGLANMTILAICSSNGGGGSSRIICGNVANSPQLSWYFFAEADLDIAASLSFNGTTENNIVGHQDVILNDDTPAYVGIVHDSATPASRIYVHDTTENTTGYPFSLHATTAPLEVGCSNGVFFWKGDIAEVLIYNKVLDAADLTTVKDHLETKWGIS